MSRNNRITYTNPEWVARTIGPLIEEMGMYLDSLSSAPWNGSDYETVVQARCIHPDSPDNWQYEYFVIRAEFASLTFAEVRQLS